MGITVKPFGILKDGRTVNAYTLSNGKMNFTVMNRGATVMSVNVPDRDGKLSDIVCGYDNLASYVGGDGYQGATVGRVANRIGGAEFSVDGKKHLLYKNDGNNSLHGGEKGFDKKIFDVDCRGSAAEPCVIFFALSPDGEEGYPGTLRVSVSFTLTKNNAIIICYKAKTTKPTPVSLTNHTYFNLAGYNGGDVYGHELRLDADSYLPTNSELIPTGEIKPVEGTPFDFRKPKKIGEEIGADDPDLIAAGGYDHCLNFVGGASDEPVLRGELYEPESGRLMKLYTDMPSVQVYSANFMKNETYPLKGGVVQQKQHAICLETQFMPDSVNHENFTDTILRPGDVYDKTTIYAFEVK